MQDGGDTSGFIEIFFEDLFPRWPLSVGTVYPVPAPSGEYDFVMSESMRAYYKFNYCETGADFWTGEYGALRRQLLDFCIKELSNVL